MKRLLGASILAVAAVAAALLVLRSAERNLGFSPDSVSYFTMAEGIQSGQGFVDVRRYSTPVKPVYPPGYSLLLAAAGRAGGDLMASIPALHAALFALGAALLAWAVGRASDSLAVMAAGAALFLASGDLIKLYNKVWSETAFVTFTLLFMVALARALAAGDDVARARLATVLAAAFAGAAVIIRYPGVAALAGGGVALLLRPGVGWGTRLRQAALFGAVGGLPLALWLGRNLTVFGRPYLGKDRAPSDFAFSSRNLELGGETLRGWTGSPPGLFPALLAALFLGLALAARPRPDAKRPFRTRHLVVAAAAFAVPYVAFMLAGTYRYGLHKPLDTRALAPLFAPILITLLLAAHATAQAFGRRFPASRGRRRVGHTVAAAALVALLVSAGRSAYLASDPAKTFGILQKPARAVVEAFKDVEPQGKVFTNIDDYLYLLTGKSCLRLPQVYSLDSREIRLPDFDEKFEILDRELGDRGLVVFYSPSRRHYLPSEEELLRRLPLEVLERTADGTIYRVDRRKP
ncbi:MAG: hypothetical protein AAGF23_10270 [Acidobacteriota bacterium]